MKYGYARVSTDDQSTALQLAALKRAGCKTLFKDEGLSGATTKRPSLLRCFKAMPDRKPPQRELAETPKQEKSQGMDIGLGL
jgi:DNA invertase Pin-like site-specific DNA recombinase